MKLKKISKSIVELKVDWRSHQSIDRAEKEKERLENEGYNLLLTNCSLDKAILTYIKL